MPVISCSLGAFARRPALALSFSIALSLIGTDALACVDESPIAHWTLVQTTYGGDLGFLSPGNDTRVNLQWLMQDASPRQVLTDALKSEVAQATLNQALFAPGDVDAVFNPGWGSAQPASNDASQSYSPIFSEGEGSRCLSNDVGKGAFIAAVQAAHGLTAAERDQLGKARAALSPDCAAPSAAGVEAQVSGLTSHAAKPFADYLRAAANFYDGAFDPALAGFQTLSAADDAWLRESARYMVGRTLLNKAQVGAFSAEDGEATPTVKDRASLAASEQALRRYLHDYPDGVYLASARGLIRRLYWLAGDQLKLSAEYGWLLTHGPDPQNNLDGPSLAIEIDSKFLAVRGDTHDPSLLAARDLMEMRWSDETKPPSFPAADLDAQAPDFKGHEALFGYLRAARTFYVDRDAAGTLALLGPPAGGALPTYLAFSREVLRGEALMQANDPTAAAHWLALAPRGVQPWQRETAELGLALTYERAAEVNRVFMPNSGVTSARIREILLRNDAGPILLRQAAVASDNSERERALAKFVLLYKEATRGHYAGFLKDYVETPPIKAEDRWAYLGDPVRLDLFGWTGQQDLYPCAPLRSVIAALAENPHQSKALLCLGEFVRVEGLDGFALDTPPPTGELGGGPSIFPGASFSRGELYKSLIADPQTPASDRAYALYRAVNCYAPSGYNGCGGKDVLPAQRKAWFQTLKTIYASSPYAKALQYYW